MNRQAHYFLAGSAVNSPSRTLASAAIVWPLGSVAKLAQIARALAVSPATWYARAAFAR